MTAPETNATPAQISGDRRSSGARDEQDEFADHSPRRAKQAQIAGDRRSSGARDEQDEFADHSPRRAKQAQIAGDGMQAPTIRLTEFSHGAGCACKLSPADLRTVIGLVKGFEPSTDPNLLVGFDTSDDAAVYRLRDDLAIVVTTDFFTPIVDDPFDWGRIAATNALSDVYAMGGQPLLALNLVGWPRETLGFDLLAQVLDGGAAVAKAAGCLIVGGHSIDDAEPKYGLAVVGTVHPDQLLTNSGAKPGDVLVLTKPIGLGVLSTALKRGAATPDQTAVAVEVMTTLNATARDAAVEVGVNAATDVTGFGLLGHLRELCAGSGVHATISRAAVPVIDGVVELIEAGMVAGGTQRNHAFVSDSVDWGSLALNDQYLLADAQTSGGLLLSVDAVKADSLVAALEARGTLASAIIGKVSAQPTGSAPLITCTP